MQTAVFQSHIKSTGRSLKKHWAVWHSTYPDAKKKRIVEYEKKYQADMWDFYLECQKQGWNAPLQDFPRLRV